MKETIRISENDYIFFDAENAGTIYLPTILAFDLSPEEGRDIFIIKIINLITPPWCFWPDRIGDRTGFVRWFHSDSRGMI